MQSQATFITSRELMGMNALTQHSSGLTIHEQRKREELKALAQRRYATWSNTLEAQRQEKEAEKKRRLDQMEAAQQAIDERERQYRKQEKRALIERANRLLYLENDRVKTFRSGLLTSKAIHERNAQAGFKEEYARRQAMYDKIHNEQIQASIEKSLQRERAEAAAREVLANEAARIRLEQLKDKQVKHRKAREEEIREGIAMKAAAAMAEEEEQAAEARRRAAQRKFAEDYASANAEAKKMRREMAQLEAIEDEKIRKHAEMKDQREAERKAMEEERRRTRQQHFDEIIARQTEHLSKIKKEEAERLEKQMASIEKARDAKERALADRRAQIQADLLHGRRLQVARQAQNLAHQAEVEKLMSEEWKRMASMLEEREKEAMRKSKETVNKLQQDRMNQITDRLEKQRMERAEEVAELKRLQRNQEGEDAIFNDYARHQIEEYQQQGMPVAPMLTTLRKMNEATRRLQPMR